MNLLIQLLARYPALSHVVIAVGLQAIISLVLMVFRVRSAWWFGATFAIAFYFSRKKLEIEFHADPTGLHKAATWDMGWIPLLWPQAYQLEFYAPAVVVILVAVAAHASIPWDANKRSPKRQEGR